MRSFSVRVTVGLQSDGLVVTLVGIGRCSVGVSVGVQSSSFIFPVVGKGCSLVGV